MAINQLPDSFNGRLNPIFAKAERQIYQQVRKRVSAENAAQLQQARGWKRHFLNWRLSLLAEMRFREILFSGGWDRVIRSKSIY